MLHGWILEEEKGIKRSLPGFFLPCLLAHVTLQIVNYGTTGLYDWSQKYWRGLFRLICFLGLRDYVIFGR